MFSVQGIARKVRVGYCQGIFAVGVSRDQCILISFRFCRSFPTGVHQVEIVIHFIQVPKVGELCIKSRKCLFRQ